jgi:restriction system protein
MAVWLVLAGRNGERESFALEENLAVIGFDELPDLSQVYTRNELTNIT